MNIISYHADKAYGIYNSFGEHLKPCGFEDTLDFLLEHDGIKVFDQLDCAVAGILALIGITAKEAERLFEHGRINFTGSPYRLTYYAGKYMAVYKGFGVNELKAEFSDASQYDAILDNMALENDEQPIKQSVDYALKVATEVYDCLVGLGLQPENLISPSNVFIRQKFDKEKYNIPTMDDVPISVLQYADECVKGNYVEAFQRGYFEQAYDYDINSAYSFHASQLLDICRGNWVYSKEYQKSATYGFAKCEINIDDTISPVIFKAQDQNYTPCGLFETYLTKSEIDYINENIGYATVISGWWWFKDERKAEYHPLAGMINWLYEKRRTSTGMMRDVIKRILTGAFYGMFLQKKHNLPGAHYLSIYGALIEANARLQVIDICRKYNVKPLAIVVDGVVTQKSLPIESSSELGSWRLSHQGRCIIVNSGLIAFEGREGEGDFSLSFDWLYDAMRKEPEANKYAKQKKSMVLLGHAIQSGCIDKLGSLEMHERPIHIGGDSKRYWTSNPINGGDLITHQFKSKAWPIDTLMLLTDTIKAKGDDC